MSNPLAVKLCRIIAPEKLPDRFLASGLFTHDDSQLLKDQVVLTYVFEVTKPWFSSSQILPAVITTLQAEHAKLSAKGKLDDQFEQLLKAVNQQLNAVSESGETDWIGNLNGLIMVMAGAELHFAQTGRCPAYLLQNNRIRQITDDPTLNPDLHPLRTFSNLASGHLVEGDQILIANHELYNEISLDALRRIMNGSTPYQASLAIARELKREKNPAIASLIIKVSDQPSTDTEPDFIAMEEEMQSSIKKFGIKMNPFVNKVKQMGQQAGQAGLDAAKEGGRLMKDTVAPKATELFKKGAEQAQLLTKRDPVPEAVPTGPLPVVEIIYSKKQRQRAHQQALAEAAEARVNTEPDDGSSELYHPENLGQATAVPKVSTLPPFLRSIEGFFVVTIPKWVTQTRSFLKIWLQQGRNKKISALSLGVLLLFLTIYGIYHSHHNHPALVADSQSTAALNQVASLSTEITNDVTLQQNDAAGKLIAQAQQILLATTNLTASQQSKSDALWQTIQGDSNTLNHTVVLSNPVATASFTSGASGFITNLPYFYGWNTDGSTQSLLRTGKGDAQTVQSTITLPDPNDSIIAAASSTETTTQGYVLTKEDKVYQVIQNDTSTVLQPITPVSGSFATGYNIATFNGNVYLLDGKTGLLWKYANSGTQYAKGVSLIDINQYNIQNTISLAIDGSFYLLKNDGTVMKFTAGKQNTEFSLNSQPYLTRTLTDPLQIITSETDSDLYVLDGGTTSATRSTARVLVYNKSGAYLQDYIFPSNLTKISAFAIDPQNKKLWVLNDNQVLEFNL